MSNIRPRYRKKNSTKKNTENTTHQTSKPDTTTAANTAPNNSNDKQAESALESYIPKERRSLWPADFFLTALKPYQLIPRNWRDERIHMLVVFALVLLLYAITTPRLVTLEDDGLFIANLKFFGVAHPPGYPIHTFLGGIFFHLLPLGTPAFKGHFFSGFVGAIACVSIYSIVIMLVRGRLFGYMAGLAYGASRTFWSQAIIAEVYTLAAMFFFIILALCIYYSSHIGKSNRTHIRLLCIIAFVYGLGVANHYPILGLGTSGLLLIVLSQWKNIIFNVHRAVTFFLLGAVPPYLWMIWRSYTITPASFYGPIEGWDRFWFYFNRSGYAGVDNQSGVGLSDKIKFTEFLGDEMLWQFTPIGFALVAIGFVIMIRTRYNWMWASLAVSWFTSSVLLIYLLDFKAEFIWLAAFKVYHILAYGIMAIWLAIGTAWCVDRLPKKLTLKAKEHITAGVLLVVVGASIFAHWEINYRREYRWAHDLAMAKLNTVEANAALFLFDDLDLPVGYLHYVEGVRPDLEVYNDQGLVYGKRLYSPLLPDGPPKGKPNDKNNKIAKIRELIDSTTRPIYYHPQRQRFYKHPRYGSDLMGFFRRVNRDGKQDRIIFSSSLRDWLDTNIGTEGQITDLWTKQQQHGTITQAINTIQSAALNGFKMDESWEEIIERARENNVHIRIITASHKINSGKLSEEELKDELLWLENFDIEGSNLANKDHKAVFFALKAVLVSLIDGKLHPKYEENLLASVRVNPIARNSSVKDLFFLYNKKENHCEAIKLIEQIYPKSKDIPKNMLRHVRQTRKKSVNCSKSPAA